MSRPSTKRTVSPQSWKSLALLLGTVSCFGRVGVLPLAAQRAGAAHTPAPIVREPPPSQTRSLGNENRSNQARQSQSRPHLSEWMQTHSNLTLAQQQHALTQEPGFQQLQPDVQQRMHDRLTQLNNMSPEQRQRTIARTEAMERLDPVQRQQVRNATQQLGSLAPDRRIAVARAFHSLRDMPEAQRQNYLNSPQAHGLFSDQERGTLNNLLTVSPYLPIQPRQALPYRPPPYPAAPPQ